MKKKLDYLREMEVIDYLPDRIIEEIKIKKYQKGEIILFSAFSSGKIFRILKGSVKLTHYLGYGKEFYGEFYKGEWIGIAGCLSDSKGTVDIEAREDVEVLSIPLGKLLEEYPNAASPLWEKIARASVIEFDRFINKALEKVVLTNEGLFLTYIKDNDFELHFNSTSELAEKLNTNIRTLQRIMKKYVDMEIIKKTNKLIRVIDKKEFLRRYQVEIQKKDH